MATGEFAFLMVVGAGQEDIRETYSEERARLAGVRHWRTAANVAEIRSVSNLRSAYEMRFGVVWMHWDVSTRGLAAGDAKRKELGEAAFLTRLLTDAFAPKKSDAISPIIEWHLNYVRTYASGGLRDFGDDDSRPTVCKFESNVFDVVWTIPEGRVSPKLLREIVDEPWRRALLQHHTIVGLAVPNLLITLRNDGEPVFLNEEVQREDEEDEDQEPLSSEYVWSQRALSRAGEKWLGLGEDEEPRSGDLLAAMARECVESFDSVRSWFAAEAEEVEVARVAPELAKRGRSEVDLARRHGWLLQQISAVRAALDWPHDGREVRKDLFRCGTVPKELEERRRQLLAAIVEVRGTLRSALDLVAVSTTAEQLELSREEAGRSAAFQSAITFVTTVLLAPALVAAVFGAMPSVLEHHPWLRLGLIVVAMVAAALLTGVALRFVTRQRSS